MLEARALKVGRTEDQRASVEPGLMVTRQSPDGTAFGVADDLPDRENRADREAANGLGCASVAHRTRMS